MDTELIVILLFDCALILGLSGYYKKYLPKEINEFYGFRTRRTMANQDIWDAANKRNAQDLWTYGLCLLLISALLVVCNISYAFEIHIAVLLLGLLGAIYASIRYLNKYFDKNGNRK